MKTRMIYESSLDLTGALDFMGSLSPTHLSIRDFNIDYSEQKRSSEVKWNKYNKYAFYLGLEFTIVFVITYCLLTIFSI